MSRTFSRRPWVTHRPAAGGDASAVRCFRGGTLPSVGVAPPSVGVWFNSREVLAEVRRPPSGAWPGTRTPGPEPGDGSGPRSQGSRGPAARRGQGPRGKRMGPDRGNVEEGTIMAPLRGSTGANKIRELNQSLPERGVAPQRTASGANRIRELNQSLPEGGVGRSADRFRRSDHGRCGGMSARTTLRVPCLTGSAQRPAS